MLCTSQPTLRRLYEDDGAPVFSWVKHANDARRREVVSEELDKYGINLVNARISFMGNPHDQMVDLLASVAQATLPGAVTSEDPSVFAALLIASGARNVNREKERQSRNVGGSKGKNDIDNRTQVYRPDLTLQDYLGEQHLLEVKSVFFGKSYCYGPTADRKERGTKRRDHLKKREGQYIQAYRQQMKKADHDYYRGVHTSNSKVDGQPMGPFETKYESMKKSLLIFTEMGAISDGLANFIDYIAEHVSPRIAGRWDVQGAWCNRYRVESQIKHILLRRCAGVATRAFANHFLSRLHFVGLRSPNKNKYHSTADTCSYSTSGYFYDPYNSRDLNPTEPTNHGCGSRRE